MKITVKLGAPLSQIVGEGKVILILAEGATAADALAELGVRNPGFEAALRGKGLRTPLDQIPYALFVNARLVPAARSSLSLPGRGKGEGRSPS
jgi:hypothetical protein